MNPLDEPMTYIDPSSVSPRPVAMRYGLIWGLIGIMVGLLAHILGWSDPSDPNTTMTILISVISLGISVTMIVLAVKTHRDQELGGYMTFGRGFTTGILTTLFNAVIATIWMVIFFSLINPDMFDMIEQGMLRQWEEQGMSEEQIEQAKGFATMFTGPTFMTIATFLGTLFWGAIISLIVSAVMKKDAPRMA
ncbi:MAG: uncharacterized membrane protein YhaH (DUF805 family) [Saprospiraceae bacterium]|jgi:uncharacterized membrane protein YhaH (DUF805 family)